MAQHYKIIISNRNIYKEFDITDNMDRTMLGTTSQCELRLNPELFFGDVEIVFEKVNEEWRISCDDTVYCIKGDMRKFLIGKIEHGDSLSVRYAESENELFTLRFVINFEETVPCYNRYIVVPQGESILLGDRNDATIRLYGQYSIGTLINIFNRDGKLFIKEERSPFGVTINGKTISSSSEVELKDHDFIGIADFSIYVKSDRLCYENGKAIVNSSVYILGEESCFEYPKFVRNTRHKIVLSEEEIKILDPSAKPAKPEMNLLTTLMPSLAMLVLVIVLRGVMSSSGGTYVLFSVCSMGLGIVTTVVGLVQGQRKYRKEIAEREEVYNTYIAQKEKEILEARNKEKEQLKQNYVSVKDGLRKVENFEADVFDRVPDDADFLDVYLGNGRQKALRKIGYKKQEKLEEGDALAKIPECISEKYKYLEDVPIVLSLKGTSAVGITGTEEECYGIFKNILADISIRQFHSDVQFYVLLEQGDARYEWVKYFPQLNMVNKSRNIVFDNTSKTNIFEGLYKELTYREETKGKHRHLIVFVLAENDITNHPLSRFIKDASKLNVSFIFFEKSMDYVPLHCEQLIELNGTTGKLYSSENVTEKKEFTFEPISDEEILNLAKKLAPVYCEEISLESTLRKNVSMFEMLGIYLPNDLDLEKRWSASKIYESMAVPLGINVKEEIVNLNLHEKAHGPHGLVAGTTGSGKSEILQSYILSAATLFHPYEIGFVIIDFKGGGMVNQFVDLPHLIGAITNIDGKEINRSLKSIKAELLKRQSLFAEIGVNHIDKYIKAFKEGNAKVALPHLVIIVDEFAELKAEQPEFMKELISAARIGRSLGVHLILATQKPAGQVNEQIWSNSKFKLCLKVQNQEDSKEVIKSPLAAEIKEPGRAYLQVGNNEIFELFQSAYSGVPAVREDDTNQRKFKIFDMGFQGRRNLIYEKKKIVSKKNSTTELEAIVKHIADFCTEKDIEKLPNICLPSLMDCISYKGMSSLKDKDMLVPVGMYDDPDHQFQGVYWTDIGRENTLAVGGSQTGKTNFIQLCIRHLVENNTPEEVSFYILDFGSMVLKNFENLCHVGGVVLASEDEKLKNLFKLLSQEIDIRKNKLMSTGVSSYSAYKEAGYNDLPKIYVIIDNFTAFKELYMDAYEQVFVRVCRDGISLGISVIITNGSATGIGYRYVTNFSNRFCFTCNDSSEYSSVLDRCRLEPKNVAGRMLFQKDKEIFEAQSYLAFDGEKEIDRVNAVKEFVVKSNEKYSDYEHAKLIPAIPDVLFWKDFVKQYDEEDYAAELPLGLNFANIEPVYMLPGDDCEVSVITKKKEKATLFVKGLLHSITKRIIRSNWNIYIIDSVERSLASYKENPLVVRYCLDPSESELIFEKILEEVRLNKEKVIEIGQSYKYAKNVVIINNKECIDYISKTKPVLDKYKELVENYKNYGVQIILSDIENAPVPYSGPELLKRVKDNRKAIILDELSTVKVFEIPSGLVRNYSKKLLGDEAFYLNGSDVAKIKLIKEE